MLIRTRLISGLLSLLAVVVAAPGVSSGVTSEDEPRELIREGRYRMTYFGRTLAEETFRIERTPTGYEIKATFRPNRGDQVPSTSTYVLDRSRRLVSATWKPLEGGVSASYRVEGNVVIAEASNGETQRVTLGPGQSVTGPHYVTDFFVLKPLGLDVGETHDKVCFAFGFKDWRLHRCELDIERVENRRIDAPEGGRTSTVVYRCEIRTSGDTYRTRSYLDDRGVSLKIKVGAPLGEATVYVAEQAT